MKLLIPGTELPIPQGQLLNHVNKALAKLCINTPEPSDSVIRLVVDFSCKTFIPKRR